MYLLIFGKISILERLIFENLVNKNKKRKVETFLFILFYLFGR
jgi:hypothetical protein